MAKGRANGFKGTAMPNIAGRGSKGVTAVGTVRGGKAKAGGQTGAGFTGKLYKTSTSATKSTGKVGGTKKIG